MVWGYRHPIAHFSWRPVAVGVTLGCVLSIASIAIWHGWGFTVAWILGTQWPGATSLQIASAWWLAVGILIWLGAQLLLGRLGSGPRMLLAGWLLGPTIAMLCLLDWNLSLIFYCWRAWKLNDTPFGLRWLLDGPAIAVWYRASSAILWRIGVPGPEEPVHFADGSSVGDIDASIIGLGILNGAMLALVLSTIAVVTVGLSRWHASRRGKAA